MHNKDTTSVSHFFDLSLRLFKLWLRLRRKRTREREASSTATYLGPSWIWTSATKQMTASDLRDVQTSSEYQYMPFVYHELTEPPIQHRNFSTYASPYPIYENIALPYTPSSSTMSDEIPVDNLTPDEANRIIHSHRKVRYGRPPPFTKREALIE